MENKQLKTGKIGIVGVGSVGSTTAYALMIQGIGSEIVLVDRNKDKAAGEAMDIMHGQSFVKPIEVRAGEYSDLKDAKVIIITAGAPQKEGETRLDLVQKNTNIFKDIIGKITKYNQDAILLVVANPVDILTYVTLKLSGFPKNRVLGSGTVLDSARFRSLISSQCKIAAKNVHGYVIGEHGDSEVPVWSLTNIAGTQIDKYCPVCDQNCDGVVKERISEQVKNAAYDIIEKKGSTYYAVALGVAQITQAILRDEDTVLTVSSLLQGEYGIEDVSLSLPTVINDKGIRNVLELDLNEEEQEAFIKSANLMKEVISNLNM
ncbi:MAG TPA: L-lactate dehydrogenase [Halanaerobiales bacterium]|nr:L-lactate dehydrogenase [Halanaerobiales bacterium]